MISKKLKSIASLILSAASLPALAAAPAQYNISYLGNFYGSSMNNLGDVVGGIVGPGNRYDVGLYSGGALRNLGTPGGNALTHGINDAGQIVGRTGASEAFIYANGNFNLFAGGNSVATGINNAGQVTGERTVGDNSYGFVYDKGTFTDLLPATPGFSIGVAINNLGQVGGKTGEGYVSSPVIFNNGVPTYLGDTLPPQGDRTVRDLNDNGQALLETRDENGMRSYFYANGTSTSIGDLGAGDLSSRAMNNAGMVVGQSGRVGGSHAFLWQDGTTYDLNTLVTGLDGWTLREAVDINNFNQIAVIGCRGIGSAEECGTLLLSAVTAVPEPSTYAMMAGGLGMLGYMARRRRAAAKA